MNLNDIMKQVNRDIDDQYIIDDIRDWVNRCLDELTPFAKKESMATTDANNTNVYELPSDLFEIAFIKIHLLQYPQCIVT
jgi:hypothetical protein